MIEISIIQIAKLLAEAVTGTLVVSESKNIDKISDEANKQALELQMAHAQAKVAQEIAIAQRIENASEVVIEEYYADEKLGEAGAKANESGLSVNVSGEARRVTKRVYRFVGEPAEKQGNILEQKT